MKVVITSVIVAVILASVFSLPVLAQESGTITITMTGVNDISISLDKTQWPLGEVAANTEYITSPPIEWCTLTVEGNSNVNTFIVGENAEWIDDPTAYEWTLSADGTNGDNVYGLQFRISGDTTRGPLGDGYVPITKTQDEFWPYAGGSGSSLAPGDTKQFGLKLLTPTYFVGNRQMQTQITISAAAA
ncbi:MAG: hypothetical protein KAQ73_01880 [Dehalococcoidia bacterium]|nr:hypothetical protein [Dehalococcoidia bacterium]